MELDRDGPGLLLRDILGGEAGDIAAVTEIIAKVAPDVLVLQSFDYDLGGHALAALAEGIAAMGIDYPHRLAWRPNAGLATGLDLDGDGRPGTPQDAQGYGEFGGQGGMALLSRLPVDPGASRDFSAFLWHDLPGALLDGDRPPAGALPGQRLSSVGHWDIALALPDGRPFRLWTWHGSPPVFDGPEDRNGRRGHDETAFWRAYLDGALPDAPEPVPFVLAGDANIDPTDGEGRRDALVALLADPRLVDSRPSSPGGAAAAIRDGGVSAAHRGDPALDTADWRDGPGEAGNLRVDYVLPSAEWTVLGAGVWWPEQGPDAETAARASRHRLVWVDVELPRAAQRLP